MRGGRWANPAAARIEALRRPRIVEAKGLHLGKSRVHHDAGPIHPKVILPAGGAAIFR